MDDVIFATTFRDFNVVILRYLITESIGGPITEIWIYP